MARPALKRMMVSYVMDHHGYSERRACRLAQQHRSVQRYRSVLNPRTALRQRTRELAAVRVRYGSRRIRILLNREGWRVSKHRSNACIRKKGWRCAASSRAVARW